MAPGQGHSSHGPLALRRLADDYMISPNGSLGAFRLPLPLGHSAPNTAQLEKYSTQTYGLLSMHCIEPILIASRGEVDFA